MTNLIASVFVTLDGVAEAPERWNAPYVDEEYEAYSRETLFEADALLLGRKTYELFAGTWPSRSGEFADRLHALPKYVVSSTLDEPGWNDSRRLDGGVEAAVSELKRREDGTVVVYGSSELVCGSIDHGLLDELRLWVHPLVRGSGDRLFTNELEERALDLTGVESFDSGVVVLRYWMEGRE